MLHCVLSNVFFASVKILVDDKMIANFNYSNNEITFDIPIEFGVHNLKIILTYSKNNTLNSKLLSKATKKSNVQYLDFDCSLDFTIKKEGKIKLQLTLNKICVLEQIFYYNTLYCVEQKNVKITNYKYDFSLLKRKGYLSIVKDKAFVLVALLSCIFVFGYFAFFVNKEIDFANNRSLPVFYLSIFVFVVTLIKTISLFVCLSVEVLRATKKYNGKK